MTNRDRAKDVNLLDHKLFHGGRLVYYALPAELLFSMVQLQRWNRAKTIGKESTGA